MVMHAGYVHACAYDMYIHRYHLFVYMRLCVASHAIEHMVPNSAIEPVCARAAPVQTHGNPSADCDISLCAAMWDPPFGTDCGQSLIGLTTKLFRCTSALESVSMSQSPESDVDYQPYFSSTILLVHTNGVCKDCSDMMKW